MNGHAGLTCGVCFSAARVAPEHRVPRTAAADLLLAGLPGGGSDSDDLRHEAGIRCLEGGFALHQVKSLLGHTNIKTTSNYLNADEAGMTEAMKKFDEARALQDLAGTKGREHRSNRNAPMTTFSNCVGD